MINVLKHSTALISHMSLYCKLSNNTEAHVFSAFVKSSQNLDNGVLGVDWTYIWFRFIKWNAKALTHVEGEIQKIFRICLPKMVHEDLGSGWPESFVHLEKIRHRGETEKERVKQCPGLQLFTLDNGRCLLLENSSWSQVYAYFVDCPPVIIHFSLFASPFFHSSIF